MRVCIGLIQYFFYISLSLVISNCYAQPPDYAPPVATAFSESAVTVDPLTKPIETTNIQKNDFQQPNDDEHLRDSIEARLRTKHNLRESVQQHTDDDKHENEQEYINRLNSALDKEYKTEQKVVPPVADSVNNTLSQNQIKEEVKVPLPIQHETISSTPTSIQTPLEQQQKVSVGPLPTEAPAIIDTSKIVPTLDEKTNLKVVSNENIRPIQVQTNEQKAKDPIQQNIIKEDVVFIEKGTLSTAQSHQQEEAVNATKSITNHIPPSSNQQQPIANTTVNETSQNNSPRDIKPSSPTPLQSDQPASDAVQNGSSLDLKSNQQQQIPETLQVNRPSDLNIAQQQKTSDTIQNIRSIDPNPSPATPLKTHQEQQITNPTQTVTSSNPQQPIPETIQDTNSIDPKPSPPTPLKTGQEQPITNPTQTVTSSKPHQPIRETIQNTNSINSNSSPPTPLKTDQEQPVTNPTQTVTSSKPQQPIPETIRNTNSVDLNPSPSVLLKTDQEQPVTNPTQTVTSSKPQQPIPETIQNTNSVDPNPSPPTLLKTDQEQQITNPPQTVISSKPQQPIPETIQNASSTDHNTSSVQENQQPQTIDTIQRTETLPVDIKSDDLLSVSKESPTLVQTPSPPTRVLRSATSRIQQVAQTRQRHARSRQKELEKASTEENATIEETLPTTTSSITEEPVEERDQLLESLLSLRSEELHVETSQTPAIDLNFDDETETSIDTTDLPRQVHVHDANTIRNELKEDADKNDNLLFDQQIENNTTVDSFLVNDHSPHLPRILEHEETIATIDSTIELMTTPSQSIENNNPETTLPLTPNDSKPEETNNSFTFKSNLSDSLSSYQYRQLCWRLPKTFEPTLGWIENQILRLINLLPEFLQTTFIGRTDDRETLMNRIWFGLVWAMYFLFSVLFLSLGAKRLKQNKHEKEIRARCQQLQQYNNQIELERATFERQNQRLSDEIDELKNLPVRDADEEIFELREKYEHVHADWKIARTEHDALQRDIDYKQSLIQKHEFDMQKQVETVAYLNDEILRQKQELEKERETIARLQSNDLSLERFEKLQETIHELKSEITQLKQDKFAQTDQLQQLQEHANQIYIDNSELTIKMKQLKDLLELKDQTIARVREKMLNDDDDDDDEKTREIDDILSTVTKNNPDIDGRQQRELLSTIDNDVEKANQHMRDLHAEIEEKTRRIKDLDSLLNQEKDRCRELETKLKVILELRERDAHLHIRQLGHSDAELRKARTDSERVRILQQQLELKQQQLDDVQRVLGSEQTKFSEECSKLQHETHEKWMEVKRLTRELDSARKECEGLRRQITKYGNSDRSSLEKTMHKPMAQHLNNTGRLSSEPETNGSSPPTLPYQQGDNFRPIDHERNDSGAASPSEMFRIRPPYFGLARPPFFPPPFMPPPPHNPFMMAQRFPMPMSGPHGMLSPIPHLMTNGSGGSDANSFEIVDSTNITPNSTSYDVHLNGSAISPTPDDERQATAKAKKPKKSLKKKTKTSGTTTVSSTKEDV